MSTQSPQPTGRRGSASGVWISLIAATAIGLIIGACAVQNTQGTSGGEAAPPSAATRPAASSPPASAATRPASGGPPAGAATQPATGGPPAEPAPGDAAKGKQVFQALACNSCHAAPGLGSAVIGPPMTNMGTVAATRRPGYSAGQYLVESITHPNDFITPGFQPNLMPATFDNLPAGQLNDLVAYLLSLK